VTETDPAAIGDDHDFDMEGINRYQAIPRWGGWRVDRPRPGYFMPKLHGVLIVEDVDKVIELDLLLQEV